jgi:methyl-accepting chemotaxis protein
MLEIVNQQVQQVSNAATQLASLSKELISSIESVHQIVTKNSEEFKGMHRSAIGINQVMSESTDISKENTDTICNINNEFTDMSTKFDEMSRKTDQLMELTMIMEGTVASFASSQMQNAK